jgi:hypothetical protein
MARLKRKYSRTQKQRDIDVHSKLKLIGVIDDIKERKNNERSSTKRITT